MALRQTDEDGNVPPVMMEAQREAIRRAGVERRQKLADQLRDMMSDPLLEEDHETIRKVLSHLVIS
jgi:hypothetical protein